MAEKKYALLTDLVLEQWFRKREADLIIWKTKKGDELSIRKMSDEHLSHAIDCMMKIYEIDTDEPLELIL